MGGIVLSEICKADDERCTLPLLSSTGVVRPVDRGAEALDKFGGNLFLDLELAT